LNICDLFRIEGEMDQSVRKESIVKKIITLSWPVMVGTILQSLVYTCDLFFVSKLGTIFASAAALGTSAAGVVFVMSALVGAGTIAITARGFGENDWDKIRSATGNGLLLAGLFGLLIGIGGQLASDFIVKDIYGVTDVETVELTKAYMNLVLWGTAFVFVNFSMRNILQGIGDTMSPLIIFGITNVLNIILDPVLIFGLDMGIKGAALATVISLGVGSVLIIGRVIQKIFDGQTKLFMSYLQINKDRTKQILRVGFWACIQQIARPVTGMLMFAIVLRAGGNAGTAAFGIGGQMFGYTFIFLSGLSVAVSIMVGQAIGRGDLEELDGLIKQGLKLGALNMAVFAVPYVLFPEALFRLFLSDPAVLEIGTSYLRIVYIGIVAVIFPVIYGGVFQGAGDTKPAMISSLVANMVFKVPAAWLLVTVFHMGTDGVWWAVAGSVFVEAAVGHIYIKKGSWRAFQLD